MKAVTVLLCLSLIGLAAVVEAIDPNLLPERQVVSELRKGGYVLFLRHFQTDHDQADTDPLHLENVQAQRQLSAMGRRQAREVGEAWRAGGIPVGTVLTSRFFRAYESAKLLGVGVPLQSTDVTEGGLVVSPRENQRRAAALKRLLSELPANGTNTVIVSHRPNLQEAAGLRFGDLGEGEVVVFKPLGGDKFEVVARISSEQWKDLGE